MAVKFYWKCHDNGKLEVNFYCSRKRKTWSHLMISVHVSDLNGSFVIYLDWKGKFKDILVQSNFLGRALKNDLRVSSLEQSFKVHVIRENCFSSKEASKSFNLIPKGTEWSKLSNRILGKLLINFLWLIFHMATSSFLWVIKGLTRT